MNFDNIYHKGELLGRDVDAGTAIVYYQHIYRTNYQEMLAPGTGYRRHACLWHGSWCWQNVREHPWDVIGYLKKKFIKH